MISITTDYLRHLGNIPETIDEKLLSPHIDSAVRQIAQEIDYSGMTTTEKTAAEDSLDVKEAIACIALALAVPNLNAFYQSDVNDGTAEPDGNYVYLGQDQLEKVIRRWKDRGRLALSRYTATISGSTQGQVHCEIV